MALAGPASSITQDAFVAALKNSAVIEMKNDHTGGSLASMAALKEDAAVKKPQNLTLLDKEVDSELKGTIKEDGKTAKDDPLMSILFPTTQPQGLPTWVIEYSTWHSEMRSKFPDTQLLENKDAPKLLLKICPRTCGGLHDRMMGLPGFLHQARMEQRVLLLKWYNRFDLESFLLPNQMNWSLPMVDAITATPELLMQHYNNSDHVLVQHVRNKVSTPPVIPFFGALWYYMFQPSPQLQDSILNTFSSLPQEYNALHLRVRHPANYNRRRDMKIDLEGLPWETAKGDRAFVIQIANKALQCVLEKWKNRTHVPLYVYSDSQDLVNYLVEEGNSSVHSQLHFVSRNINQSGVIIKNAHLDYYDNSTNGWLSYAGTFLDLTVAIHARCLALGVGNFAVLAYHIGNHSCLLQHKLRQGMMSKQWGYQKIRSEYCV